MMRKCPAQDLRWHVQGQGHIPGSDAYSRLCDFLKTTEANL